jgi:hypothetical protein
VNKGQKHIGSMNRNRARVGAGRVVGMAVIWAGIGRGQVVGVVGRVGKWDQWDVRDWIVDDGQLGSWKFL